MSIFYFVDAGNTEVQIESIRRTVRVGKEHEDVETEAENNWLRVEGI